MSHFKKGDLMRNCFTKKCCAKQLLEKDCAIKDFILSNWTGSEKALLAADILLLGVLIGWVTSPFRRKVKVVKNVPMDITIEEEEEE